MSFTFPSGASWIWHPDGARRLNRHVCFRRRFDVAGAAADATLALTADSQYEVFLNGAWLGFGPARAYPERWPVDAYDLGPWLRPGENVLAVAVHEIGIGTFHYLDAPPGLLAHVAWRDDAGEHRFVTGGDWRAADEPGYRVDVPRITCRQGWEEQFDARSALGDWTASAYDDRAWAYAVPTDMAGTGAHSAFVRRDVPMLTRRPRDAARLVEAVATHAPTLAATADFREYLNLPGRTADHQAGDFLVAARIHSPTRQIAYAWQNFFGAGGAFRLNGQPLALTNYDAPSSGPRARRKSRSKKAGTACSSGRGKRAIRPCSASRSGPKRPSHGMTTGAGRGRSSAPSRFALAATFSSSGDMSAQFCAWNMVPL